MLVDGSYQCQEWAATSVQDHLRYVQPGRGLNLEVLSGFQCVRGITGEKAGAPDLTHFLAQERKLTSPYYNSRFFSTLSPIFRLIIGKAYE